MTFFFYLDKHIVRIVVADSKSSLLFAAFCPPVYKVLLVPRFLSPAARLGGNTRYACNTLVIENIRMRLEWYQNEYHFDTLSDWSMAGFEYRVHTYCRLLVLF